MGYSIRRAVRAVVDATEIRGWRLIAQRWLPRQAGGTHFHTQALVLGAQSSRYQGASDGESLTRLQKKEPGALRLSGAGLLLEQHGLIA